MSSAMLEDSFLRTFDLPNRCINCAFLIPKKQQKHPLDQASPLVINTLQSWITPTQVPLGGVLCTECFELITNHVNTMDGDVMPLDIFGHKNICFPCGKSILRAQRTYPVKQDRPERNYLLQLVPLHLGVLMERVCAACWRSAARELQQQQQHDSDYITLADTILSEHSIPRPQIVPSSRTSPTPEPKIKSSIFRRAANTSSHCIFGKRCQSDRLQVPLPIKEMLLCHYKFYVPSSARICHHHLDNGCWGELTSKLSDFTGRQFDNIMTMMQRIANRKLNFSNISIMPPHLCKYWLGMNSDQFYELLNSIPELPEQVPNASLALCAYLVKKRTGDTNERLATLFNKSRPTLERWMTKVHNCLIKNETDP